MSLTIDDLQAIRTLIREEVRPIIKSEVRNTFQTEGRGIIREEVENIFHTRGRKIVREEINTQLIPIEDRLTAIESDVKGIYDIFEHHGFNVVID